MSIAVSLEDVTFAYGEASRPALEHVRGQIDSGTFVAVMGHGSAGKSTLCCTLNALVPRFFRGKFEGRVLIEGIEAARQTVAQMSRLVGMVFQDFEAQIFSTDVELEVAFGLENHCLPREEMESRIRYYLTFAGIDHLRKRFTANLSGGQKQRLAIASVAALEPRILVMDEPTTDLDPRGREDVLSISERLRERDRTMLMVDHEPETALKADELWLMRDGEMIARGRPGEVLTDLSLLESCGVKAPQSLELFRALGWPGAPLTAEEAISLIERHALCSRKKLTALCRDLSSDSAPILLAEGLSHTYALQDVDALSDVDLAVREGEFVAVLGQNGSGKTTLAKHMNGLLKPTRGRMLVRGRPTEAYRKPEMARIVGYVFQNPDHQIFGRTVHEEVAFGPTVLGEAPTTVEDRVAEALAVVGLEGFEDRIPFVLTKGERQRVAVASVLASQPQVIILDEPTTGLDYRRQREIMEMLKRLHRRGHTIIIITHSMWVAAEYAERTVVMKDGRILLDRPTRAVFAEEGKLEEMALSCPALVKISNWLGAEALTVEGLVREIRE